MDYSHFLFYNLLLVIHGNTMSKVPYDILHPFVLALYDKYTNSKFNDSTVDEWQCMHNFVINEGEGLEKSIISLQD